MCLRVRRRGHDRARVLARGPGTLHGLLRLLLGVLCRLMPQLLDELAAGGDPMASRN